MVLFFNKVEKVINLLKWTSCVGFFQKLNAIVGLRLSTVVDMARGVDLIADRMITIRSDSYAVDGTTYMEILLYINSLLHANQHYKINQKYTQIWTSPTLCMDHFCYISTGGCLYSTMGVESEYKNNLLITNDLTKLLKDAFDMIELNDTQKFIQD